ncbi:hypothetical protein GCM10009661_75140 [Catellatospora chokoriensis]|uniref:Mutator family transposase n=1 Tax=Catellatospora chokoriensis TaxID=310353 RepID=A0A8J3NXX9_9ACTN|nr:hypothetical protein Cch02nite_81890 [Catellatospora chokoriensis]
MIDALPAVVDDDMAKSRPTGPDSDGVDAQLIGQLVEQARAAGLQLTGEGGLLAQLTKRVLEAALEGEITDHLGYERGDPVGNNGGNSRNCEYVGVPLRFRGLTRPATGVDALVPNCRPWRSKWCLTTSARCRVSR